MAPRPWSAPGRNARVGLRWGNPILEGTTTDLDLLERWRAGDAQAGNELVRRHFRTLYRFFRNKVDGDFRDLVQSTFLTCMELRDRAESRMTFRSHLLNIARHKLLHHYRKAEREGRAYRRHRAAPIDRLRSTSQQVALHEEQRLLLEALRSLPTDMQTALELFYWEALPLEEIAAVLEVPVGTIKSRLSRARNALRDRIAELPAGESIRRSTIDGLDRWAASIRDALQGDEQGGEDPDDGDPRDEPDGPTGSGG